MPAKRSPDRVPAKSGVLRSNRHRTLGKSGTLSADPFTSIPDQWPTAPGEWGGAVLRAWSRKKDAVNLARQTAIELELKFGTFAYDIAQQRLRDNTDHTLPEGHWDRVRLILARRWGLPVVERRF